MFHGIVVAENDLTVESGELNAFLQCTRMSSIYNGVVRLDVNEIELTRVVCADVLIREEEFLSVSET